MGAAELVLWLVAFGLALAAPLFALPRLWRVLRDRDFRRTLLAHAACSAAATLAAAYLLLGGIEHLLLLPLLAIGAAAAVMLGIAAERTKRADPRPGGAGRHAWTASVGIAAIALSFPLGVLVHRWEEGRAKRWVAAAVREVRAERERVGRCPATLEPVLARLPRPPRFVARTPRHGYDVDAEGKHFCFAVDDPSAILAGGWVWHDNTGAWTSWWD